MNLAELKNKLRIELSYPPEKQLSDHQAEDAVYAAIKEYTRYKPIVNFDIVYSNRGKALYDLSGRHRLIRVKRVYYYIGFQWIFQDIFPDPNLSGRLEGINLFENPSIWIQYMQRLEQYQKIFDGAWEYNGQTKMLRLIPVPTFDQRPIPFLWSQLHLPETVPEEDIDDMIVWAQAQAKRYMASLKQREITSISGFGQSVTIGVSAKDFIADAEKLEEKFKKRFGGTATIVRG